MNGDCVNNIFLSLMIISNLSCLIGFNEEKKVDLLVALTNQESIKLEEYRKYAFFRMGISR